MNPFSYIRNLFKRGGYVEQAPMTLREIDEATGYVAERPTGEELLSSELVWDAAGNSTLKFSATLTQPEYEWLMGAMKERSCHECNEPFTPADPHATVCPACSCSFNKVLNKRG